jgi:hypothetical protein
MMTQAFGRERLLRINDTDGDLRSHQFADHTLEGVAAVAGHVTVEEFTNHPRMRERLIAGDRFLFTVVRDPIARAVSLFNYLNAKQPSDKDISAKFETFSRNYPQNRHWAYLDSAVCSPMELVDAQFACTTDQVNDYLPLLLNSLRPGAHMDRRRIEISGHGGKPIKQVSESALEEGKARINAKSERDRELLKFVSEKAARELADEAAFKAA